jgi:probable F420-dependent oxidoreductase
MKIELGRIGIWSGPMRRGDPAQSREAAVELEKLGYGAIWMPAGSGLEFFILANDILEATSRIAVASGILSIWTNPAPDVAASRAALVDRYPGRFLLGLGVSHASRVEEETGQKFEHPVAVMRQYLDDLAATRHPVPAGEIVLAALGPRMLETSRDRAWGAHPYFVTPEHTRLARFVLGPGHLLAPEQAVVLDTDPDRARMTARLHTGYYLRAPNYTNNLLRLGYDPAEFKNGGSDRIVDALVAWGDLAAIRRRVDQHFAAGADHVSIQVLTNKPDGLPRAEWRALAALID